ncbi:MAG: hypothetical protein SV487_03530, partial [Thermodesulfobacteriota bacterium]|nr:hypothetical protein [Thermodesulfobacteriota bacterium]
MPGHSEEKAVKEVRRRIQKDMGKKAPLFVPRPCIFELGNRIAQVNDGGMRHKLVKSLLDMVEKHNPLTITPMVEREPLSKISTPFIDK